MKPSAALSVLGSQRVIWIDDVFNETPKRLAAMLIEQLEATRASELADILAIVGRDGEPRDDARDELTQYLYDCAPEKLVEIRSNFFEGVKKAGVAGKELSPASIDRACGLLDVKPDDRWHFERAYEQIDAICGEGDLNVSYVVDLNNAANSQPQEGIEILLRLSNSGSRGTAFILTHDVEVSQEHAKETELRNAIRGREQRSIVPVCVIAKERLSEALEIGDVEQALTLAIKRAGLQRSIHEVVWEAKTKIVGEFAKAADALIDISAEHLESHVVERAYKEGSSELHVVERALTAHLSRGLRQLFATDDVVRASATRMRSLRQIKLASTPEISDDNLADFRRAEVWETDDLINASFAPIACGDVFESDMTELGSTATKRRFLMLGQPCDISIRPEKDRQHPTALFVPLEDWNEKCRKATAEGKKPPKKSPKMPLLPFAMDGVQFACNFRSATAVRLGILDLASFRADGVVRVDEGQSADVGLLPGHARVYSGRVAAALKLMEPKPEDGEKKGTVPVGFTPALQLTFQVENSFKSICQGQLKPANRASRDGLQAARPKRVTWQLRRSGRIRMPYASALLDDYMTVMSRQAFDIDFMTGGFKDDEEEEVSESARKAGEKPTVEDIGKQNPTETTA